MSATTDLTDFAQDVHLIIKNRFRDDIEDEDGQTYIRQVASWVNMYLDELETEVGPNGESLDWTWSRSTERLGIAREGRYSVSWDADEFLNLLVGTNRYVQVQQDGTAVSNFAVVSPSQITNKSNRVTEDMVALVGENLVFSRNFNESENGGQIVGDVTVPFPRITFTTADDTNGTVTATNVDVLTLIKPVLLLKLGVAKNASLPDIVQGQLSPSYAQKYADLLNGAIARSMASSASDEIERDDFTYISGVN